jgi:hypothetical protein
MRPNKQNGLLGQPIFDKVVAVSLIPRPQMNSCGFPSAKGPRNDEMNQAKGAQSDGASQVF